MKKHITSALLALVVLASLAFMPADGVTVRLKPQQGKTYSVTSKSNMMTMLEVQGQTMNMSQVYETKQSFTAKEVSDKQCVIDSQIDAVKMTISQMGMKLEYDSEHPEKTSPMLADQISALNETLKKSVTLTFDERGQQLNDEDTLSGQLKDIILTLPEEPLSVGSTWTSKKAQEVKGDNVDVEMEYIVTAISKKSIDLEFTGTIQSEDMSGSYNGTVSLDPKTGLVMNSSTKSNISMTVTEQGLSIPTTVVATTTIDVK